LAVVLSHEGTTAIVRVCATTLQLLWLQLQ